MNKKIKKILFRLTVIILVFVCCTAALILYPQPLFANKVEYKQFSVYANEKMGDEIKPVLDAALSIIGTSELYDSAYKVDVILSYNTYFNWMDDRVFGEGPTARTVDNNLVFKARVDVKKNLVYATFHKPCEQPFAYLIAHEIMHGLQAHKYGILKFNPFKHPPMWKLEGYPEYVARQKNLEPVDKLKEEIKRFIKLNHQKTDTWISVEDGGCEAPEFYYKGRLMTEYLINVRHWSYDQILNDEHSEDEIFMEMTGWAGRE